MVDAFVAAGIPLHKFRNAKFRDWLKLNLKDGSKLPSETALRLCLTQLAKEDSNQTKAYCK